MKEHKKRGRELAKKPFYIKKCKVTTVEILNCQSNRRTLDDVMYSRANVIRSAISLAVSNFKRDGAQIQEMFLLPDPFLVLVRGGHGVWGRD